MDPIISGASRSGFHDSLTVDESFTTLFGQSRVNQIGWLSLLHHCPRLSPLTCIEYGGFAMLNVICFNCFCFSEEQGYDADVGAVFFLGLDR
jgi:hypothetical protein